MLIQFTDKILVADVNSTRYREFKTLLISFTNNTVAYYLYGAF